MTESRTQTLDVPGAVLTYDVRSNDSSTEPPLLLIGSPMAASGFVTLAGHFPDRTIVTYDPRGSERSHRTDGTAENTPEEHADDVHRLISTLRTGAVDIFATSGGAVNALALVARHPEDVRILIAHEPPLWQILPDREAGLAQVRLLRGCLGLQLLFNHLGLFWRPMRTRPDHAGKKSVRTPKRRSDLLEVWLELLEKIDGPRRRRAAEFRRRRDTPNRRNRKSGFQLRSFGALR